MSARRAMDVKVKVKPVFVELIHSGVYEGPCRIGKKENIDPARERQAAKEGFEKWMNDLRSRITNSAELLAPFHFEWTDRWNLPESQLNALGEDLSQIDLFLIAGGLSQYPAMAIGRKFRKPIVMVGTVTTMDVAAALRSIGLEGYAPIDIEEMNSLIDLLKVRKAIGATRMLIALEENLEDVQSRLGVEHVIVPAQRLLDGMNNLSKPAEQKAQELTDKLMANAQQCNMKRGDLLQSVRFYAATESVMEERDCNAFTIPCFELCARTLPEKNKVVFCLAHGLLKDDGFPSACEADTNVLLAIMLLEYVSAKSPYMGNCSLISKTENIIRVGHSVPGLKLKGLDSPDVPYSIEPFTVAGWGATLRYDFSKDAGEQAHQRRSRLRRHRLFVGRSSEREKRSRRV